MSKRIENNTNLFNQIKEIEIEYTCKLNKVLLEIQMKESLDEIQMQEISTVLICTNINLQCVRMHEYNDKNDREYVLDNVLFYYMRILDKNELAQKYIADLYEEAMNKVRILANQIEAPRKILTIDNMETLKDYHKLMDRFIDNVVKGSITDEVFKLSTNKLFERGKEIGVVNW